MSTGLILFFISVIVTIVLYWHRRYISTKRALVNRLSTLQHDVHHDCSEPDVYKTWDESLKEIWVLYNVYSDFASPFKRGRLRKAWENYKGEDPDRLKKLANDGTIVDIKTPPKNKNDFLHKIKSLREIL